MKSSHKVECPLYDNKMSKIVVPPVPESAMSAAKPRGGAGPAKPLNLAAAMDAAFLARVYRSMLWVGIVMTAVAFPLFHSLLAASSFVGGIALAALLLRTQEVVVRAALRPSEELGGFDPRLAMVLTLPLKYVLVIGSLAYLQWMHLLQPTTLGLGFFVGQLVLVSKVAGLLAVHRKV